MPRDSVPAAPTIPCRTPPARRTSKLRHQSSARRPSTPTRSTASRSGAKNNIDNRVKIASSIYYIRWNNIQQTVVPPICQISFIANLGQAVAKGADIQARHRAHGDLHRRDLCRLHRCAIHRGLALSGSQTTPIVSSGDAITGQSGQPAPPVTVSMGLQYKFKSSPRNHSCAWTTNIESRPKWLAPTRIRPLCSTIPRTTCCPRPISPLRAPA